MAAETVCKVEDCGKPANRKGLCNGHYHKLNRYGDPLGGRPKAPGGCAAEECGEPHYCGGFCTKHYQRHRKHGDPEIRIEKSSPALDWLLAHVGHDNGDCLKWPFHTSNKGYGQVNYKGTRVTASRLMCTFVHGEPPADEYEAAHSCGKGHEGCVNPRHLRWATPSENQLERAVHGTSNAGERHWTKRKKNDAPQ